MLPLRFRLVNRMAQTYQQQMRWRKWNPVVVVVVVMITPPLPRDVGTARTANQVHAVNLIEIRLGERWQPISNQS